MERHRGCLENNTRPVNTEDRATYSAVAQMGLHAVSRDPGSLLHALLRPEELSLLLRHRGVLHAGGALARIAATRLHAGGWHSASANALDCRFFGRGRGAQAHRIDQLYVREPDTALHAGPVVVPLLAADSFGLARVAPRLRKKGAARLDASGLG